MPAEAAPAADEAAEGADEDAAEEGGKVQCHVWWHEEASTRWQTMLSSAVV